MSLVRLKVEELAGHIFSVLDTNRSALLSELYSLLSSVRECTESESPVHLLIKGEVTKEIVRSEIEYVLKGETTYTSFFPALELLSEQELNDKELVRSVLLSVVVLIKDSWNLECFCRTINDITLIELPYNFYRNDVWGAIMKDSFIGVEESEVQYVRWSNYLHSFINPLELGRQLAKEKMVEVINQVPSISERLLQEDLKLEEQLSSCSTKKESKELRKKKDLVSRWLKRLSNLGKQSKLSINPHCYFKPVLSLGNPELDSGGLVSLGYLQALKYKELYHLGGDGIESQLLKLNEDYFITLPSTPLEIIELLQLQTISLETKENKDVQDCSDIWL